MDERARVTVVIPAFKAEATIRRAVDSVLAQEGVALETIVVVDGRLDATAERLRGYDPGRVRVIAREENRGAQASRNEGLAAAGGEFVMFLDCDDFVEGPLLAGLAERLRTERADLAFAPMRRLKEASGRREDIFRPDYRSADHLFCSWLIEGRVLNPSAIMWRTDFLRRIGGWDERVKRNQDGEVVLRSVLKGARFALSDQGCGIYVIHDSAERVTKRPENLPSALEVGEILTGIESSAVSEAARRRALAGYFFRIGLRLHAFGRPEMARRALSRSRELGLRETVPIAAHRLLARAIGLPFRLRLLDLDHHTALARLLLGLAALNVNRASSPRRIGLRGERRREP